MWGQGSVKYLSTFIKAESWSLIFNRFLIALTDHITFYVVLVSTSKILMKLE